MQIKTKAFVISSIRYSEADLIVKCFTQEKGLVSYMLKGIRKSKKGKLKMSMFQTLSLLELDANHREHKNLQYIKEAKVIKPYKTLHTNIYKSTIIMYLAEVLKDCIQEEEQNEMLFQFLEQEFMYLDDSEQFKNFHLHFIVKLSQFLGFYPDKNSIDFPYFDMINGVFQLKDENRYSFQNYNVELLKQLMQMQSYQDAEALKLNQNRRQEFLDFMMLYYELHLQGFKKPKSLDILKQMF